MVNSDEQRWSDFWTDATIGGALDSAADLYGDREAFVFANARPGFLELQRMADKVARGFLKLGIGRGDRVAVWMAGYAEWAYLYFGLAKIGAIIVPVNTRYKPEELEYVLRQSGARVLVFRGADDKNKNYTDLLAKLYPELHCGTSRRLTSDLFPKLRWIIDILDPALSSIVSFSRFLEAGDSVSDEEFGSAERQVSSQDVALIQFTSGTTALPKGAQLYQEAMLRAADFHCGQMEMTSGQRFFSPQPFYHAGGSVLVMLSPIVSGCTTVVQSYFDPTKALRLMEDEKCNITMGHQPHYVEYLNNLELGERRLKLQKGLIFANPDMNKLVYENLKIEGLLSPFGMTETHLGGTACSLQDPVEARLNTVGRPGPGIELKISEPQTQDALPSGEVGELCLRGWCVMKGYFQEPERTAEVIDKDGWFHTGDLAVIRPDGNVQLMGRIKDMIRVGGENVAAAEVESFLIRHPAVKQAAVIGQEDPRLGEVCVAFVELKEGTTVDEERLVKHCKGNLASFKVPRSIRFLDEWPMTGSGKIQKVRLKELLDFDERSQRGVDQAANLKDQR